MNMEVALILSGWLNGMAWLIALETSTQVLLDTYELVGPLEVPS